MNTTSKDYNTNFSIEVRRSVFRCKRSLELDFNKFEDGSWSCIVNGNTDKATPTGRTDILSPIEGKGSTPAIALEIALLIYLSVHQERVAEKHEPND